MLTQKVGENAVGDLLLVAALLVQVLVLEDLGQVRRPVDEDVPLRAEEELDGAVRPQRLVDVLAEDVRLVDVLEEGYEGDPEWDGGYVLRISRREEEEVVREAQDQSSEEQQLGEEEEHVVLTSEDTCPSVAGSHVQLCL